MSGLCASRGCVGSVGWCCKELHHVPHPMDSWTIKSHTGGTTGLYCQESFKGFPPLWKVLSRCATRRHRPWLWLAVISLQPITSLPSHEHRAVVPGLINPLLFAWKWVGRYPSSRNNQILKSHYFLAAGELCTERGNHPGTSSTAAHPHIFHQGLQKVLWKLFLPETRNSCISKAYRYH